MWMTIYICIYISGHAASIDFCVSLAIRLYQPSLLAGLVDYIL